VVGDLGSSDWPERAVFFRMAVNTMRSFSALLESHHRVCQNVYRGKPAGSDEGHLKLTVIDDVLIVSLKEL
jgi:hypothetical protein